MDLYGLIGYPLGHSFSRGFFTEKFQREGIDAEYRNYEIPDANQLLDVLREIPQLRVLNCTIPHKQAIIPLLNEMSDEARRIGAVNVIAVSRQADGTPWLKGYNSDIIGFMDSIRPLLQSHHKKALVLGTGGASRAICVGLEKLGLQWRFVSRSPREGAFTYDELNAEVIEQYQVIVNCSPVGMFPHVDDCPNIPYQLLTPQHLLYDVVYNPLETLFMKKGAAQGAVVKNGLEMLHLQALASWRFWNEAE